MGKQELDNLVQIGKLKAEAASRKELDGMPASARRGLVDVQNESIETDSRIYRSRPAAHRFALAALRLRRIPIHRIGITVVQTLVHRSGTALRASYRSF